jgi:hypothetical protein
MKIYDRVFEAGFCVLVHRKRRIPEMDFKPTVSKFSRTSSGPRAQAGHC